jgi:hypothetical protein
MLKDGCDVKPRRVNLSLDTDEIVGKGRLHLLQPCMEILSQAASFPFFTKPATRDVAGLEKNTLPYRRAMKVR